MVKLQFSIAWRQKFVTWRL